jgi:hypothetical protein
MTLTEIKTREEKPVISFEMFEEVQNTLVRVIVIAILASELLLIVYYCLLLSPPFSREYWAALSIILLAITSVPCVCYSFWIESVVFSIYPQYENPWRIKYKLEPVTTRIKEEITQPVVWKIQKILAIHGIFKNISLIFEITFKEIKYYIPLFDIIIDFFYSLKERISNFSCHCGYSCKKKKK